jgi:putative ABC transport system substrate-binding protein
MDRRGFIAAAGGALAWTVDAFAQQPGRAYRIGSVYIADPASTGPYEAAFLAGLRELGFEHGRNLVYDVRHCNGDQSKLPGFVDELITLQPDLLAGIEPVAQVMRAKTVAIPIILTISADPVGAGLVNSLARPGGNVTGMAGLTEMMAAKQVELLGEILPRLTSVATLLDPGVPATPRIEASVREAAKVRRARVSVYRVRQIGEIARAFEEMERDRPDALVVSGGSGMMFGHRKYIAERALQLRVPLAAERAAQVEAGALFSYGASLHDMFRRAGSLAARVLRGASPADLPVEQATMFEMVINRRTARALDMALPPAVLVRADRVIE